MSAPVFPALTQASASPLFTSSIASLSEESFFFRNASAGGSSIATTSDAGLKPSREP